MVDKSKAGAFYNVCFGVSARSQQTQYVCEAPGLNAQSYYHADYRIEKISFQSEVHC